MISISVLIFLNSAARQRWAEPQLSLLLGGVIQIMFVIGSHRRPKTKIRPPVLVLTL